jgi:hypothetical protein
VLIGGNRQYTATEMEAHMSEKETYYTIITDLWKLFREDYAVAGSEHTAESWLTLVGKYDTIFQQYRGTRFERYASEMIMAHVHELERIWKDNFFDGVTTE